MARKSTSNTRSGGCVIHSDHLNKLIIVVAASHFTKELSCLACLPAQISNWILDVKTSYTLPNGITFIIIMCSQPQRRMTDEWNWCCFGTCLTQLERMDCRLKCLVNNWHNCVDRFECCLQKFLHVTVGWWSTTRRSLRFASSFFHGNCVLFSLSISFDFSNHFRYTRDETAHCSLYICVCPTSRASFIRLTIVSGTAPGLALLDIQCGCDRRIPIADSASSKKKHRLLSIEMM